MAVANITVNGVAASNDDVTIDTLVTLANQNNTGVATFFWSILDQPAGATDSLSSASSSSPTFTPKKEGTYVIKLTLNSDPTLTDTKIVAVRQFKTRERIPGAGETTQDSTTRGWAQDLNSNLQKLEALSSDPLALVGVVSVNCSTNKVVRVVGASTIKSGLPGEEVLPTFASCAATDDDALTKALYVSQGGVNGSGTPSVGDVMRAKARGVISFSSAGSLGDPIFVDDSANLSLTPGTVPREVGYVLTSTRAYFDGRQLPATYELINSSGVPISSSGRARIRMSGNKIQFSENGGAYFNASAAGGVSPAPSDAAYLTNGAVSGLSAEVNIQALTTALSFIAAASGGKLVVKRFNGGDTGNKFEVQTEGGIALAAITGEGNFECGNLLVDGTSSFAGDVELNGNNINAGTATITGAVTLNGVLKEFQGANVASANNLFIVADGNLYVVTGSTQINLISSVGWQNGARATFLFTGSPTIKNGQTTSGSNVKILLFGGVDFIAAPGDILSLVLSTDGSTQAWRELGRVTASGVLTANSVEVVNSVECNDLTVHNIATLEGSSTFQDELNATSDFNFVRGFMQAGVPTDKLVVRRFNVGDTGIKLEVQDQAGATVFSVSGNGDFAGQNAEVQDLTVNNNAQVAGILNSDVLVTAPSATFTAGQNSDKLVVKRFDAGDLANNKLEVQDEVGNFVAFIRGDGNALVANLECAELVVNAQASFQADVILNGNNLDAGTFTTNLITMVNGRILEAQGTSVTAANNLSLAADGNLYAVTGNTQINLIDRQNWQNGARITLLFTGAPTVKHDQATSGNNTKILLAGAVDFSATAGDTLSLILSTDGTTQAWRETGRAVI